jgi:transposase
MTHSKHLHSLMPFPRYRESEDDRAIVLIACWGDRGYDAEAIRQGLCVRHISSLLAKRNTKHGSGLGKSRWVVERTFAWFSQFRRLRVRYEKRADIHEAFLSLGCVLICWASWLQG